MHTEKNYLHRIASNTEHWSDRNVYTSRQKYCQIRFNIQKYINMFHILATRYKLYGEWQCMPQLIRRLVDKSKYSEMMFQYVELATLCRHISTV